MATTSTMSSTAACITRTAITVTITAHWHWPERFADIKIAALRTCQGPAKDLPSRETEPVSVVLANPFGDPLQRELALPGIFRFEHWRTRHDSNV